MNQVALSSGETTGMRETRTSRSANEVEDLHQMVARIMEDSGMEAPSIKPGMDE